jgi:uncharacterized membrane protein YqgA involved in biofilm formation
MRGLGTLINIGTVTAGSLIGLAVGDRLPARMRETIMAGLGLVTLAIGVVGLYPLTNPDDALVRSVVLIAGIILGGVAGEFADLEGRLQRFGDRLRAGISGPGEEVPPGEAASGEDSGRPAPGMSRFVEGYVVASPVFCVGPLTILGATQDGLGVSIRLLTIKSALDGVASVGFASVYGWGVLGSLITIVVYQGGLTAAAALIGPLLSKEALTELGVVGSVLILGIALRLLDIARVRIVNLMPALVIGPLLAVLVDALR